jgi:hypothetical protein
MSSVASVFGLVSVTVPSVDAGWGAAWNPFGAGAWRSSTMFFSQKGKRRCRSRLLRKTYFFLPFVTGPLTETLSK